MARLSVKLYYHLGAILRVIVLIFIIRATLLVLGLPIGPIPYIDQILYQVAELIREIALGISGSRYLPRFAS